MVERKEEHLSNLFVVQEHLKIRLVVEVEVAVVCIEMVVSVHLSQMKVKCHLVVQMVATDLLLLSLVDMKAALPKKTVFVVQIVVNDHLLLRLVDKMEAVPAVDSKKTILVFGLTGHFEEEEGVEAEEEEVVLDHH